jgi:hypothetical protein
MKRPYPVMLWRSLPSVPGAPRRPVSSSPVSLSSSISLPPARTGCRRSSMTAIVSLLQGGWPRYPLDRHVRISPAGCRRSRRRSAAWRSTAPSRFARTGIQILTALRIRARSARAWLVAFDLLSRILDSGAKRNALKRSGFERPFQARQSRLGMMGWTAPRTASACQDGRCRNPSEGKPSMGTSIQKLSSVTRVGLDLAKRVFQVTPSIRTARLW